MPHTNGISDTRIINDHGQPLISPYQINIDLPKSEKHVRVVKQGRTSLEKILQGDDSRFAIIMGPCSIHDEKAAVEYAGLLGSLATEVQDRFVIIMRAYFEKPRTTVGWKGLLTDPDLNGSDEMNKGLHLSRSILLQCVGKGLPCATEYLESFTPQFNSDLISWAAIGARTTESPQHRALASGLSMPVGFKNGTSSDVMIAINAMLSARESHSFLGINTYGAAAVMRTKGNPFCHVVLRGGETAAYDADANWHYEQKPNYDAQSVDLAQKLLRKAGLSPNLMIDCSHGNSSKKYERQPHVFEDIIRQRIDGNNGIVGTMIETNLESGSQKIPVKLRGFDKTTLTYGQSITDGCIGWNDTVRLIRDAYRLVGKKC